ncbi:hypothetical protein HZA42_02930 [Candidatus Peregrinibacteria bacterium]|nr:hypothetical protein [Candidatus Peregrinibacteria bacterium]
METLQKKSGTRGAVALACLMPLMLILGGCADAGAKYVGFAQCLTERGVKMYGAFWCSHCANQKKLFGSSFSEINYIECDPRGPKPNPGLCLEKKIESFPTWEFQDGSQLKGELTFKQLAEKSTCKLPAEDK